MKYFVTTIASLLATIVAARGGEKAPPAATDDGNIMSRVLALEKIVEEQRVQLEDVHDVVSSLQSRRTQRTEIKKCLETDDEIVTINCPVLMNMSLVVRQKFTANGDSLFEGGNVFITNGEDNISEMNGKGNLIVGGKSADVEANPGSHNVIIGSDNKYSSFGGLVVGKENEISGKFASVTGGRENVASGLHSSISGGRGNQAKEKYSSVSGGAVNIAHGEGSSISGGAWNNAEGSYSSIGGGKHNKTPFSYSTVTGSQYEETRNINENLP